MPRGWASQVMFHGQQNDTGVHPRLVRTAPIIFLLLAVLPLLLAGVLSTIRSRGLLQDQAAKQLEKITANEVLQINQFVATREKLIDRLISEESFQEQVEALLASIPGSPTYAEAQNFLLNNIHKLGTVEGDFIDQIIILRQDGTVIFSTDDRVTNSEI